MDEIQKLSATCPVSSKIVGDTTTLKCTAVSGVAPFIITFFKDGVQLKQYTGVLLNTEVTTSDINTAADAVKGSVVYSVTTIDSCTDPAPQTISESCTVSVVSNTGSIIFSSTPSGADIYIDNVIQIVNTPATITGVSTGSHSYTLRLSGYSDATGTVMVTAGLTAAVSITLTPTTGSIGFSSTPSGADIYINSILQSLKTPATITSVSAGSHSYILRLTGYNDATGTVTVTAGTTSTVSVTLTPVVTTGSISFASSPSGANVYLDGTLVAITPATITSVSAGSHTYIIRLTGYNDATGTVTVTSGMTSTVSVTLTPTVTTGSISFASSPSGADIYLDGTLQAVKTPSTITSVSTGSHSYTLKLSGYNDSTGSVTVTSGGTSNLSVTLTPTATYNGWIARMGGTGAIKGNLVAIGNIIDGYLGMVNLGFTVTLANVGTTIDYYLGL
jgi:hypothetical protein